MRGFSKKLLAGAAVLGIGVGMLGVATAQAWWDPWGGPYGGGPYGGPYGGAPYGHGWGPQSGGMTADRQHLMKDHGTAMRRLVRMFQGRGMFDRREATKLAREVEAGGGENLWRLYAPGTTMPGSRTAPWVWKNFDKFKGYAEELKVNSGNLADALEKRPTAEDYGKGVWVPDQRNYGGPWGGGPWGGGPWGGGPWGGGPWGGGPGAQDGWGQRGGAISKEALDAFDALMETCNKCHSEFRTPRW